MRRAKIATDDLDMNRRCPELARSEDISAGWTSACTKVAYHMNKNEQKLMLCGV